MILKRAFFSAVFSTCDSHLYVFGGYSGKEDMEQCEKYNIGEDRWHSI